MSKVAVMALGMAASLAAAGPAGAQTCPVRLPPAPCTASAPGPGERFTGPVLQVLDARTLCVALGPAPDQWVQVEIADAAPDAGRGALMGAAFGRDVQCVVTRRAASGVRAVCIDLDGISVGRLADSPDVRMRASDWR